MSQMVLVRQNKREEIINEINGLQKKKQKRTLSRSFNKTSSSFLKNSNDPENEGKIHPQK